MMSTRRPTAARAVAKFMTVVVLPTPPFWFATAMTLLSFERRACSSCLSTPVPIRQSSDPQDRRARRRTARQLIHSEFGIFCDYRQFTPNI